MGRYEYKVMPSPRKPRKAKGMKTPADRFANALTEEMNAQAASGWEFVRAETLPMEEKPGVFKKAVETFQTVLVFRRELPSDDDVPMPTIVARRELPAKPPAQQELTAARDVAPPVSETEHRPALTAKPVRTRDPIKDAVASGRSGYWD